jgi:hypothetical protein
MMLANKKMEPYLDMAPCVNAERLEYFNFLKIGEGYFFKREINENVETVIDVYKKDPSSDWTGFEYGTNKIHLEDLFEGSIQEVAASGIFLVQRLANDFKNQFNNANPVFWLGIDEFSEFPSVTLGFYVEREGDVPLLPKNETALDNFSHAVLIAY